MDKYDVVGAGQQVSLACCVWYDNIYIQSQSGQLSWIIRDSTEFANPVPSPAQKRQICLIVPDLQKIACQKIMQGSFSRTALEQYR